MCVPLEKIANGQTVEILCLLPTPTPLSCVVNMDNAKGRQRYAAQQVPELDYTNSEHLVEHIIDSRSCFKISQHFPRLTAEVPHLLLPIETPNVPSALTCGTGVLDVQSSSPHLEGRRTEVSASLTHLPLSLQPKQYPEVEREIKRPDEIKAIKNFSNRRREVSTTPANDSAHLLGKSARQCTSNFAPHTHTCLNTCRQGSASII